MKEINFATQKGIDAPTEREMVENGRVEDDADMMEAKKKYRAISI